MEIVLEGPGKNSLGTKLMTTLLERLEEAGNEPVLLRGAGDAFSAGLNLKEVRELEHKPMGEFLELLQVVVARLFHHPAPTVACVNGHAIAGGAVIARACDVAICDSNPRLKVGLNEVSLGLRFPPRVLSVMKHKIPARTQQEVFLGAGLHTPSEAQRLGLVDSVSDTALADAQASLERLAAHPRDAYAATKKDLQGHVAVPDPEMEAAFMEEVVPAWTSEVLRARITQMFAR